MIESDGQNDIDWLELDLHTCTPEDFEQFYPPSKTSVLKFDKFKDAETLMCIDTLDTSG
jgi:hypothetical protein